MTWLRVQRDHVKSVFEIRRHFQNPWLIVLMRMGLVKVPYFLYRLKNGAHHYSILARPTTTSMADLFILREVLIKEAYADVLPWLPRRKIRFLDIGANLGCFTLWMHRRLGVSEAFCFEPEPDSFRLLNFNLALNECTTARSLRCAIGGKSRQAMLALKETSPGGTNLYAEYNKFADAKPVSVVAFQEWLQEVDGEFDLLKMDCECSEWEIIDQPPPDNSSAFRSCWRRCTATRYKIVLWKNSNDGSSIWDTAPFVGTTKSTDCTSESVNKKRVFRNASQGFRENGNFNHVLKFRSYGERSAPSAPDNGAWPRIPSCPSQS
jgi:FkbM family methyltransferase